MKQSKWELPVKRRKGSERQQEIFAALRQFDEAGNISVI